MKNKRLLAMTQDGQDVKVYSLQKGYCVEFALVVASGALHIFIGKGIRTKEIHPYD